MKGYVKTLIAGGVIAAIGLAIMITAICGYGEDAKHANFQTVTYTSKTVPSYLSEDIGAGSVKTEFYDGDKIVIVYPDSEVLKTSVCEERGLLEFRSKPKWFMSWGVHDVPQTVVKIPKDSVLNVNIDLDAGKAELAGGTYGEVVLDVDAGYLSCGDIECKSLRVNMDAGKVSVKRVKCELLSCDLDAGDLSIGTADVATANFDVDAGSAYVTFKGSKKEFSIFTRVSAGRCNVSPQTGSTSKRIDIDLSAGKINLDFML